MNVVFQVSNLTLVGDFKTNDAIRLVERYFGRIPRSQLEPQDTVTLEMPQIAEKRMYGEAEANPRVEIVWHTVPFGHRDSYALAILGQILSTQTGRLYKGLGDVGAYPVQLRV